MPDQLGTLVDLVNCMNSGDPVFCTYGIDWRTISGKGRKSYNAYDAGQNRQVCAGRSAANVVVKAQGELLMQLYGLFDQPLRISPEGVSLMLCRLPRTGGRPHLSLSTPAIYGWLER